MAYLIDSKILNELVETGRAALASDSNDKEHDALYDIVKALAAILSDYEGTSGSPHSNNS